MHPAVKRNHASQVVFLQRFGQRDLPGQRPSISDLLPVGRHELATLSPLAIGLVIYADDDDLVVREQLALDRLAESKPMKDRAEHGVLVRIVSPAAIRGETG